MGKIRFQDNQTILFIGDSITDCARRQAPYAPLGRGYVHFAANSLQVAHPDLHLIIENRGIGGDTTRDLIARWETDCIALKPDIVSLMIGINDLWYKYGQSYQSQQKHVPADEYEENMRLLLARTKQQCHSQLILMEPYMFCDDPNDLMLNQLSTYLDIVHRLANEFDAVLVPVHNNYMNLNPKRPAACWAEAEGATTLALAVTTRNAAARALYASLGMAVVGQYHYRMKPALEGSE